MTRKLVEHAAQLGDYALTKLQEMKSHHRLIGDVRGKGLLLGIELICNGKPAIEEAERVMYGALKRGLNFKVTMGNILTLTPALTLTQEEMEQALTILDTCIGDLEK